MNDDNAGTGVSVPISAGILRTSEQTDRFWPAFLAAQQNIANIPPDKLVKAEGQNGSYSYPELATVLDAVRPPLNAAGICILQPAAITTESSDLHQTTRLVHAASGQWIENTFAWALPDLRPWTIASAQTYARRYALTGLVTIAGDQDLDARNVQESYDQRQRENRHEQRSARAEDNARKENLQRALTFEQHLADIESQYHRTGRQAEYFTFVKNASAANMKRSDVLRMLREGLAQEPGALQGSAQASTGPYRATDDDLPAALQPGTRSGQPSGLTPEDLTDEERREVYGLFRRLSRNQAHANDFIRKYAGTKEELLADLHNRVFTAEQDQAGGRA